VIRIAWIFPRHLSTYGDAGNVQALDYRCRARGIEARVVRVEPGDRLPPAGLVFIGGGQDRCQAGVSAAIAGLREGIAAEARDGAVVLGVCAGYQLLGHFYQLPDGTRIPGLGLLDVVTQAGAGRLVGKVVVRPTAALGLADPIVGFENHSGRTVLGSDPGLRPLGAVVRGHGNNGTDGSEGAFTERVFGTYLHGPLLPNNPQLCDLLLRLALQRHGKAEPLPPLDDSIERAAAAAYRG
jgi:CobQ-like glutamine amidotransferase family enzyme